MGSGLCLGARWERELLSLFLELIQVEVGGEKEVHEWVFVLVQ